ncbi:MAG TPA: DUF4124 domain-containing protein [Steroidobacteraceae bacterium]|nr:DUF4124 domain-containing protein [Steroidobacteraceae bacterium]
MSWLEPRVALGLLAVLIGLVPGGAVAAGSSTTKTTETYKWVDEQGVIHYGDRVPPQYSKQDRSVLNSQGVEVRHLDAQRTPEQIAADERAREEVIRQKQHDSFLMTTYTSVKDIEALRDVRLDQLRGQKVAAEQYVESLHSRLSSLQSRAMSFKPYSARPEARRMPDDLAEDLVRTMNELRAQTNALTQKGEEETNLRAQFQADIERYRELHTAQVQAQR